MSHANIDDRIKADWRKLKTPSEIKDALCGVLTHINAHGMLPREVSKTATYKVYDTVDVPYNNGCNKVARMVAKWDNPTPKTMWGHTVCGLQPPISIRF